MTNTELLDAIKYMNELPVTDPYYSSYNFDEAEYEAKLKELMEEQQSRRVK